MPSEPKRNQFIKQSEKSLKVVRYDRVKTIRIEDQRSPTIDSWRFCCDRLSLSFFREKANNECELWSSLRLFNGKG